MVMINGFTLQWKDNHLYHQPSSSKNHWYDLSKENYHLRLQQVIHEHR